MTQSLIDLDYAVEAQLSNRKRKVFKVWLSLTRIQFNLIRCGKQDIADKKKELQFNLGLLSRCLNEYFSYQEKVLSMFLDESSMSTTVTQHRKIIEQVNATKNAVARLKGSIEGRTPTGIAYLQKSITDIRRRVEEDAIKEEMLLRLIRTERYCQKERLPM